MPGQRLLVALLVPEPIGSEVDGLRLGLGDTARPRIPPHITLVPPANVPDADVGSVLDALRAAAGSCSPLELALGPVATFHPVNPVLYLAVGAAEAAGDDLARLAALRQRLLVGPLRRTDRRPFVPHVTVCRSAEPTRIPEAVSVLSGYRRPVRCDTAHLLQHRGADGEPRRWEPVADVRLGEGPHVVGVGGLATGMTASALLPPDAQGLVDRAAGAWPAPGVAAIEPGDPGWWLSAQDELVVVARRGDAPVGAAHVDFGPRPPSAGTGSIAGRLDGLVVATDVRRQGIGLLLVRQVEWLARRRGVGHLRARVQAGSEGAAVLAHAGWTDRPERGIVARSLAAPGGRSENS